MAKIKKYSELHEYFVDCVEVVLVIATNRRKMGNDDVREVLSQGK